MARGTRRKTRRAPNANEFVVYRDRRGRIRKFRKDLLLVGEIRSKKSGRVTGYLNYLDKKTKKPIARRFSPMQKTLLETRKVELRRGGERFPELSFVLYSNRLISEQIPTETLDRINQEVRLNDQIALTIEIRFTKKITDQSEVVRKTIIVAVELTREDLARFLAVHIAGLYRGIGVRFSPKKHARTEKEGKARHRRKMYVQLWIDKA